MKPIIQKGYDVTFAKDQEEYLDLPAHKGYEGEVTTCWRMSWMERLTALFTANIYIQVYTFNNPLQPMKVGVDDPLEGKGRESNACKV